MPEETTLPASGPQDTPDRVSLPVAVLVITNALPLAASHALSFYWNYVRGGEYRHANPQRLMIQPYARVVVLHFAERRRFAVPPGPIAVQARG